VDPPKDELSVRRALADVLAEGGSVERVEFSEDGAVVTLWTRDVGFLLGRRGTTGKRIRAAIEVQLHRIIQLNIGEVIPPDHRPPEFAGVPLRPRPSEPSTTAEADSDPH
jgi:ribosomal protein S3